MVSEKGDVPEREDAIPSGGDRVDLVGEITETGEAEVFVTHRDEPYECHAYDTYTFDNPKCFFTVTEDHEEAWVFEESIVSVHRH